MFTSDGKIKYSSPSIETSLEYMPKEVINRTLGVLQGYNGTTEQVLKENPILGINLLLSDLIKEDSRKKEGNLGERVQKFFEKFIPQKPTEPVRVYSN